MMTEGTAEALVDWAFAAVTTQALKGRRVVIFGHDSMGMETALAHVIPTRQQFGIEITRLDMKLLADMLNKKAYNAEELKALRAFVDKHLGKRLELRDAGRFGALQPEPGAVSRSRATCSRTWTPSAAGS